VYVVVVWKGDVTELLSVTFYVAEIKLPTILYSHGARRVRHNLN
jgi:hypothetical protein